MKNIIPLFYLSTLASACVYADTNADIEQIKIIHKQAYRGDIANKDLPQSISTIDKSLLVDLGLTDFQDTLDLSASISRKNNSGALWDSFSIRGFSGNENMPSGYLINGFSGGRGFSGPRDVSNIEYVEVLKGPGSALYGRSEPGGTINIVTKKPQFIEAGQINLEIGDYNHQRISADYTNGLTDKLAVRINGAWQDSDSFRDQVTLQKQVFTPSLYYQINQDSSLTYEFEYVDLKQHFDRGIIVLNNDFNTLPADRFLGNPNDKPMNVHSLGHQLTYHLELNSSWSLLTGLNYRTSTLKGFSSDAELATSRQSVFDDGETLTRQHRYRNYSAEDLSARVELSGHLITGDWIHHLLIGLDSYDYDLNTALSRFRGGKGSYSINIFDNAVQQAGPEVSLLNHNIENQQAYGLYVQDQIDITHKFKVLLGLRFDEIEQTIQEKVAQVSSVDTEQQLSPRLGLVYNLTPQMTLYSSYSEGFVPLSSTDAQGNPFGFEHSDSLEFGVKYSNAAFNLSAAIFEASKDNILVADPANIGFLSPLGKANSQGLELDIDTYLFENTQVKLSYAYIDAKTSNDVNNPDWNTPIPKGSPLVNVPEQKISLLINQTAELFHKSANFGARYEYIDERLGDAADLSFRLPDYQVVNVFAHLNLTGQTRVSITINNLFNERYIESSYNALWAYPGAPRMVKAALSYEF
ncbi:TonB-dependent siderophore receptor [Catenovulum sp. 2E275]|uniref:TonB-dependent siderophore receptor n=1 Tax=Catenovulum sp. 2E275 TaxID=2980497 RepID=UPI0021CFDEBF|nr:TonB-dependent siderophore receptor [Catenovulum sp. 2E275]MCU4677116.1 TonB-dependent siderophore receptor [Catenovulum sp. 2E275]